MTSPSEGVGVNYVAMGANGETANAHLFVVASVFVVVFVIGRFDCLRMRTHDYSSSSAFRAFGLVAAHRHSERY